MESEQDLSDCEGGGDGGICREEKGLRDRVWEGAGGMGKGGAGVCVCVCVLERKKYLYCNGSRYSCVFNWIVLASYECFVCRYPA